MSQLSKFVFRVAQPKDKDRVLQFLFDHFIKEEPCSRALKMTPKTVTGLYTTSVDRCLEFPFSTIVTEPNGKLAACILSSVWNRTDPVDGADFGSDGASEPIRLFVQFLNKAHSNFWKVAPPHVDAVLHREIGSVAKPFIRSGIATRLITENMTMSNLKKYNIGGVISETSSLANQRLLKKAGFKCLKEMPYSEIVDSKGREVMKPDDGTTALRLNYKAIGDYKNLPE